MKNLNIKLIVRIAVISGGAISFNTAFTSAPSTISGSGDYYDPSPPYTPQNAGYGPWYLTPDGGGGGTMYAKPCKPGTYWPGGYPSGCTNCTNGQGSGSYATCITCPSNATCLPTATSGATGFGCNPGYSPSGDACILSLTCQSNASINTAGTACQCNSGYYLSNGTCISCPTNYATCTPTSYSCPSHSSINAAGTACQCNSGYYFSGTTCQLCPTNYETCTPTSYSCPSYSVINAVGTACQCNNGYQMVNGSCQQCNPGSAGTSGTCTSCIAGVNYSSITGATSCTGCPTNYATCTPTSYTCPSNSSINTAGTICQCDTGYYPADASGNYNPTAPTQCYCPGNATCSSTGFTCNSGYYKSGNICNKCSTGCSTCTSSSYCTACTPGNYLDTNHTCDLECTPGNYCLGGTNPEMECPAGTTSWFGASSCTPCPAGQYAVAGSGNGACFTPSNNATITIVNRTEWGTNGGLQIVCTGGSTATGSNSVATAPPIMSATTTTPAVTTNPYTLTPGQGWSGGTNYTAIIPIPDGCTNPKLVIGAIPGFGLNYPGGTFALSTYSPSGSQYSFNPTKNYHIYINATPFTNSTGQQVNGPGLLKAVSTQPVSGVSQDNMNPNFTGASVCPSANVGTAPCQ